MNRQQAYENFVLTAQYKHNNKFDYSLVQYKNAKTIVAIKCPSHDVFHQTPNDHINSKIGCPQCIVNHKATLYRKSLDQFINEAASLHDGKYDYSLVVYHNAQTKVNIICPIHGIFEQKPNNHIKEGNGCPQCAGNIKRNTEQFVKQAKNVHGIKYLYTNVVYKNSTSLVEIICPEHGSFAQLPPNHLKGHGCVACSREQAKVIKTISTSEFIHRMRTEFNSSYDYSLVNYINCDTEIKIGCPVHGIFQQSPTQHIGSFRRGNGCPLCGNEIRGQKRRKRQHDFINEAASLHEGKYDYSLVQYELSNVKVKIMCSKHGEFLQKPSYHLNGQGCPHCGYNSSDGEKAWLNSLHIPHDSYHRHVTIHLAPNKWCFVDGFDPSTKTVYEYYGDYWHGNPKVYNAADTNPKVKKSYGELYGNTRKRRSLILDAGYNLVEMWEHDWKQLEKIKFVQRQ